MLEQPGQVRMGEVLHRSNLALDAKGLRGIEEQLQRYQVIGDRAVFPGGSRRPKNGSLAPGGNLGTYDIPPAQSGFNFPRHKRLKSHLSR